MLHEMGHPPASTSSGWWSARARRRRCWAGRWAATCSPRGRSTGTDSARGHRRAGRDRAAVGERGRAALGRVGGRAAARAGRGGRARSSPTAGRLTTGPRTPLLFAAGALGRRLPAAVALALFELEYSGRRRLLRRLLPGRRGRQRDRPAPRARAARAHAGPGGPPRRGPDRPRVPPAPAGCGRPPGPAHRPAAPRSRCCPSWPSRQWRSGSRRPARVLAVAAALVLQGSRRRRCPGPTTTPAAWRRSSAALAQLADDRSRRAGGDRRLPRWRGGRDGRHGRLAGHAHELDPETSFVLGLDTVGSGEPVVLEAEGGLWPVRYREPDVALVERAAHEPASRSSAGGSAAGPTRCSPACAGCPPPRSCR